MTTQTRHEMHIFTQLHTCTCMVPFLKISRGRGLKLDSQRGEVGKYMHGHPPPPPKEKNTYIIYTFLAAHEYKIAAGLQGQN